MTPEEVFDLYYNEKGLAPCIAEGSDWAYKTARELFAQAIREAKAEGQVEAYDHWLDFVQKLHAGLAAAKDTVEKDPTYCQQHHDALQELQYMEKGAQHIYDQLLGSYDALRDSLVEVPSN